MRLPDWHEEPIDRRHDRKSFDCGNAAMNDFLQHYARQSHELGGAKTFLAIDTGDGKTILGFYSLAPGSVTYADAPKKLRQGLAKHEVPGFRLARLATDVRFQGRGLGGQLLLAAARRCLRAAADVGGVLLIIDAKDERAAKWYESYGAVPLTDKPLTLVMALATFEHDLRAAGYL